MTNEEFKKVLDESINSIVATLDGKAKEYAIGDRLYNFKRAAEMERTTPEKALLGMLSKHLVSVIDLIEGSLTPSEQMVNEKVGDAINYLILLKAIFAEKRAKHNADRIGELTLQEVDSMCASRQDCAGCILEKMTPQCPATVLYERLPKGLIQL